MPSNSMFLFIVEPQEAREREREREREEYLINDSLMVFGMQGWGMEINILFMFLFSVE